MYSLVAARVQFEKKPGLSWICAPFWWVQETFHLGRPSAKDWLPALVAILIGSNMRLNSYDMVVVVHVLDAECAVELADQAGHTLGDLQLTVR
jgi:hypothetical protein